MSDLFGMLLQTRNCHPLSVYATTVPEYVRVVPAGLTLGVNRYHPVSGMIRRQPLYCM